jgi:hypothetical protein
MSKRLNNILIIQSAPELAQLLDATTVIRVNVDDCLEPEWLDALLCKITRGSPAKSKDNNCNKKALVTIFFTGTKLLVLGILPREGKFNQDRFLALIVPELLKENSNSKRRVGKKN